MYPWVRIKGRSIGVASEEREGVSPSQHPSTFAVCGAADFFLNARGMPVIVDTAMDPNTLPPALEAVPVPQLSSAATSSSRDRLFLKKTTRRGGLLYRRLHDQLGGVATVACTCTEYRTTLPYPTPRNPFLSRLPPSSPPSPTSTKF
jgi:hypothetical protein